MKISGLPLLRNLKYSKQNVSWLETQPSMSLEINRATPIRSPYCPFLEASARIREAWRCRQAWRGEQWRPSGRMRLWWCSQCCKCLTCLYGQRWMNHGYPLSCSRMAPIWSAAAFPPYIISSFMFRDGRLHMGTVVRLLEFTCHNDRSERYGLLPSFIQS